ncbi:MAG: (2Fe-2S)-binding protein [Rhodocyclaceae bacterium]|nr:(2Fe-2S)-binding protein [Rhodocyclaceae bacterium]
MILRDLTRRPFRLLTGRLRDQWHGMSRTGRIPRLFSHAPEPRIELHPGDLARRGWSEGQFLRIASQRGAIVLPAATNSALRPGQAFVAMHWGRRSLSHDGVNALTSPDRDPISQQPELKHAAIRIEPIDLPWRLTALRLAETPEAVLEWQARLTPFLAGIDCAAPTLDGREHPRVALRVALAAPAAPEFVERIARALDMPASACLVYRDPGRNVTKRALIEEGHLTGLLLAGEDQAGGWLRAAMLTGLPIAPLRRWLFAPSAEPPVAEAIPHRMVCNCHGVDAVQIERMIATGADLVALQEKLKCGTACGSCLPEIKIKRMLTAAQPA